MAPPCSRAAAGHPGLVDDGLTVATGPRVPRRPLAPPLHGRGLILPSSMAAVDRSAGRRESSQSVLQDDGKTDACVRFESQQLWQKLHMCSF
jgi:hypothetical protein